MRGRRVGAALAVVLIAAALPAGAQGSGFGIGVILGEPTGVSAKWWLSGASAIDLAAAWSFAREPSVTLHGDYLAHFYDVIRVESGRLPLYAGLGGSFTILAEPELGIRFVGGACYLFEAFPVDVFLEVAPIFLVLPATAFDFAGAIGARYYFPARSAGRNSG